MAPQNPWGSMPMRQERVGWHRRFRDRQTGRCVSKEAYKRARATIPDRVWDDWTYHVIAEALAEHNRIVAEMVGSGAWA